VSAVAINGLFAYAASGAGQGVFGSTDGAHSWHALGPPGVVYVQALAVDPRDASVVYAGVYGKTRGLYETRDGGSHWQQLGAPDADITAIALDPEDPSTLFVAATGGGGVLESTDGGTSWTPASSGLPTARIKRGTGKSITEIFAVSVLAIDPAHPATLYAAVSDHGVFRSTDAGRSWHPFNAGLTDRNIDALALDATGRALYAGTADGGIVSIRPGH
jgi:photosystem II stability/assembly factor-like uncharacterized protein